MSLIKGLKDLFTGNGTDPSEYWNVINETTQVDEVLERSHRQPQLLYKHSNRCGTCMFAKSEIESSSGEIKEKAGMHFVDVIRSRAVSDYIAEKLNLRHESPQAILLVDGKVVWHNSHSAIKGNKILSKLY